MQTLAIRLLATMGLLALLLLDTVAVAQTNVHAVQYTDAACQTPLSPPYGGTFATNQCTQVGPNTGYLKLAIGPTPSQAQIHWGCDATCACVWFDTVTLGQCSKGSDTMYWIAQLSAPPGIGNGPPPTTATAALNLLHGGFLLGVLIGLL